jgi:eukaryotic-like serine/threonine-protein kinase
MEASPIARIRSRPTTEQGAIVAERYVIQGFVGDGAMARVYLAEDLQVKKPVALKVLHRDRTQDQFATERFIREVRVASTIRHPNVIRVFGAGEREDGVPYMVLEFLFGESIGELLRRDGSVELGFALPLLHKAASGLAAAHRAGIIHRDVKPDNLFLVGERGDPYELKVVDFGMAKLLEGTLTAAGMTLGTLEYMAPEQALADEVDARADVYGLGVVMFRMLTGRLPFHGVDGPALIAHHLLVAPPRPVDLRPSLDPRIEAVILTALRKHPDNRYPSMDALIEDLERIQGKRAGALTGRPLRRRDIYEPKATFSQAAARALEAHLANTRDPPRS